MKKKRIGLVVPSSNTTMETDFVPRMPNDQATLHVARMHIKHTTREEEERMVDVYFPQCLDDLESADVDIILFGCTSAGTLHGNGTESAGSIIVGSTEVAYTNSAMYELPETGGGGAMGYRLMGSGMLLTLPILYAIKGRYRGRRVKGG